MAPRALAEAPPRIERRTVDNTAGIPLAGPASVRRSDGAPTARGAQRPARTSQPLSTALTARRTRPSRTHHTPGAHGGLPDPTPALKTEAVMAKKKGVARTVIHLECTESRQLKDVRGISRYSTTKNKKNTPARLELMKFNKYLRRYTLHREVK